MRSSFLLIFFPLALFGKIALGIDVFLKDVKEYRDKKIGLIINQTSLDRDMKPTCELLLEHSLNIHAIFSPEHGFRGNAYAFENVSHSNWKEIPIYSLHGKTRRPTEKMLEGIDILIYDIQCIGTRSYTYETTLFYVMEEAAQLGIEVIVLDRPNPMGGFIVDGPMLDDEMRSYIGYINIPYCHGMTIGELAHYFNEEYDVGCELKTVPMKGWNRKMQYSDTGLSWVPPSPNIPEADTALFYPTTGIIGEMQLLNIGIGYTLPFKIIGAPWIDAEVFAKKCNEQKLPGVKFIPFYFRPFFGRYKGKNISGIKIQITDIHSYQPLSVQYVILGMIKSLYPEKFEEGMKKLTNNLFKNALGSKKMFDILQKEKYIVWKLIERGQQERKAFLKKRESYLFPEYQEN